MGKIQYDNNIIGVRTILRAIRNAGFEVEIPNKDTKLEALSHRYSNTNEIDCLLPINLIANQKECF